MTAAIIYASVFGIFILYAILTDSDYNFLEISVMIATVLSCGAIIYLYTLMLPDFLSLTHFGLYTLLPQTMKLIINHIAAYVAFMTCFCYLIAFVLIVIDLFRDPLYVLQIPMNCLRGSKWLLTGDEAYIGMMIFLLFVVPTLFAFMVLFNFWLTLLSFGPRSKAVAKI